MDKQHAFLINRNKIGSMVLAGESLYVLEVQPASYAILATNEAEKAADIKVVDFRMIGATGRVYLSGNRGRRPPGRGRRSRRADSERDVTIDRAELRALVREVVRDAVSGLVPPPAPAPPPGPTVVDQIGVQPIGPLTADEKTRTDTVRIATDKDLDAFVRQLLRLFENPKTRADLRNGRLSFRLAGSGLAAHEPRPTASTAAP